MVGVPGKYKGCETCRARRVKCDNQRPFCKKCEDSGRQCAGYERETVFIIGTVQDGGRCSSHPPRVVKSLKKGRGKKSTFKPEEEERLDLAVIEPVQPAWDDLVSLSNFDKAYKVQLAALHTTLDIAVRAKDEGNSSMFSLLSLPQYESYSVQPFLREDDFELRSQCLIHLAPETAGDLRQTQDDSEAMTTDSICLFLYEHNNSAKSSIRPRWSDPAVQADAIRRSGPDSFRLFPRHHFFVRVYRHNAICAALLNRKTTFLADQEWVTTPWETHQKTKFDELLDVVVLLPSIFARADRIFPHDPTLHRRLMAQDLLSNCLNVEKSFDEWYIAVSPPGPQHTAVLWIDDPERSDAQIPFADPFAFQDAVTAMMLIYYWTSLILFYPCIERLHYTIFQPVMDSFPPVQPSLPRSLQINPLKYVSKEVRDLAANVCRGLDFALNATVQPDMLVVPLFVVQELYRGFNESNGDSQLEMMWCEGFRVRLATKGQDIVDVIRDKKWQEVFTV